MQFKKTLEVGSKATITNNVPFLGQKVDMSVNMGILGLGYLGKQLCKQSIACIAWGTYHRKHFLKPSAAPSLYLNFQWEKSQTWGNLPEKPTILILTIPPVLKDPRAETERLIQWSEWMRQNRPQLKRMVYISSTSVYPDQSRLWQESHVVKPDRPAGIIRLATEKILGQYFDLFVIRPGGIYGPKRNIIQRVLNGNTITKSNRAVHRIHVADLASIVKLLVKTTKAPRCLNVVDQAPCPSFEILTWFQQQNWLNLPTELVDVAPENKPISQRDSEKHKRLISNHRLLHEMKYSLQFPSFREGLEDIFRDIAN